MPRSLQLVMADPERLDRAVTRVRTLLDMGVFDLIEAMDLRSHALLTRMAALACGVDVGLMASTRRATSGGDRLLTLHSAGVGEPYPPAWRLGAWAA
jgi:hypothetical protein